MSIASPCTCGCLGLGNTIDPDLALKKGRACSICELSMGYQWVINGLSMGYHGSLITPIDPEYHSTQSTASDHVPRKITCPFGHASCRNMWLDLVMSMGCERSRRAWISLEWPVNISTLTSWRISASIQWKQKQLCLTCMNSEYIPLLIQSESTTESLRSKHLDDILQKLCLPTCLVTQ